MVNLDLWQKRKKELKWTYDTIAENANISKRTVADIFRGFTTDPRIETVQAIERALGLSEWSADEKAEGVGEHAVNLSADEWEWLELRSDIIEVGGQEMLATIIELLRTMIKTNKKK